MHRLVQGIQQFRSHEFEPRQALYAELASGQRPRALFITCSDSRVDPNLLTQSQPGELFMLRNAGNLVPPYGDVPGGEAATIEYAIDALQTPNIVVCGHTRCGAMQALLDPAHTEHLPAVRHWLMHAEATRRIVHESDRPDEEPSRRLLRTIEQNVVMQLAHLKTHPAVAAALAQNRIQLHGWVYHFETGQVTVYDRASGGFVDLLSDSSAVLKSGTPGFAP